METIGNIPYTAGVSRTAPHETRTAEWLLLSAAAALYALYLTYLTGVLQFGLVQSDVLNYWRESLEWATPYSTWWVPGYPLAIALVRGLTFDSLPPAAVMVGIAAAFYLIAVKAVYELAGELRIAHAARVAGLFAVYPFVGLTYSVYPMADVMALAALFLTMLAYERQQWVRMTVYAGCAVMIHKAMWFFVPPLMIFVFLRYRQARFIVPFSAVPLITWIVAGAVHHGDVLWFMRWSMDELVRSRSVLPVADGLLGPFLTGSPVKILKGLVVAAVFSTAVVTAYGSLRRGFWTGAALSIPIVLMACVINQYEIWAVVRFSRVLIIPIAMLLLAGGRARLVEHRWLYAALFTVCLISNFAYGYYVSRAFFV
jgi:hypothetical protein